MFLSGDNNKPINKTELMKRGLSKDTPTQLQTAAKKIGIKIVFEKIIFFIK